MIRFYLLGYATLDELTRQLGIEKNPRKATGHYLHRALARAERRQKSKTCSKWTHCVLPQRAESLPHTQSPEKHFSCRTLLASCLIPVGFHA